LIKVNWNCVSVPLNLSENLKNLFPFELDDFQKQAIAALNAGQSVVVCAPTGSGKTLIGEYVIHRALSRGGRVFYTTPLKALSNQKLRDFRHQFGVEKVGLLTGDLSLNRDAQILVMTTEIFRNMLYGTEIGAVGTSLDGVEAVVLDECHYMNDRQRGTVWEESVIYCPPEIQLVALSATVANSQQLTDWICQVHGPTQLIYSDFRPVPLQFHFCTTKGLVPLLDGKRAKINPKLKPRGRSGSIRRQEPSLPFVLSQLWERDMLPAIYFIFSRRGCDRAVEAIGDLTLVNPQEARELRQRVEEFLERNPEGNRAHQLAPLLRGVAAHHAGILPAWKGLVEELFQAGLIKVVFATETLAAGINMPARTTLISSLSKRTDEGHRLLTASEFLQMSGRAGRRGMDAQGYVVTLQTRFEGAKEAAILATKGADPLVSQFTPTYGMVLNLLQTHPLEVAKELVESSFGQYLASQRAKPELADIEALKNQLKLLKSQVGEIDEALYKSYQKLRERLKVEQRLLKILEEQADETQRAIAALALQSAKPGNLLSLKGRHVNTKHPILALWISEIPGAGKSPNLICLSQDNRWYVVTSADVVAVHEEKIPFNPQWDLFIPSAMTLKPGESRKGDEQTASIAALMVAPTNPVVAPEVYAQQQLIVALEAQLSTHPLNQFGSPSTLLKRQNRVQELEKEIRRQEQELQKDLGSNWQEFLKLIDILVEMECLLPTYLKEDDTEDNFGYEVTLVGESAAAIRGDNELWLGLALNSGFLDDLDPHHLAAACAALVTEVSRPDTWTKYQLSPEVERVLSLLQKNCRSNLFKVQRRHGVAVPVWLERDLVALVEQWALGVQWSELYAHTSLDEGDIVRILRRTLDFLSQIPHVPHLSDSLRDNARRAMGLIDRFPVNEMIN
jgi:superfamily II RNA helicase